MNEPADEGGENPCFAHLHLVDRPRLAIGDAGLAKLVRGLADAVVICDARGTIAFWNDACERLFGWSADEAVSHSLDLIIPPQLRQRHWDGYRRTMATGDTKYGDRLLHVPAMHRDGHRLSIAFTVTLLHDPSEQRPSGIAAVIRDESEQWQERRRLVDELSSLRAAAASP